MWERRCYNGVVFQDGFAPAEKVNNVSSFMGFHYPELAGVAHVVGWLSGLVGYISPTELAFSEVFFGIFPFSSFGRCFFRQEWVEPVGRIPWRAYAHVPWMVSDYGTRNMYITGILLIQDFGSTQPIHLAQVLACNL
jgi:hypothetical protein